MLYKRTCTKVPCASGDRRFEKDRSTRVGNCPIKAAWQAVNQAGRKRVTFISSSWVQPATSASGATSNVVVCM